VVPANVNTYRALFPSDFASVAEARQAVSAFAEACGFDKDGRADIVLAVGEACNNAAEHGHVDRGHFTVGCVFHNGTFRAEVRDRGCGFDPAALAPYSAEQVVPLGRGRGIAIMRALMDRVTHSTTTGGTTVILEKRIAKSVAARSAVTTLGRRTAQLSASRVRESRSEGARVDPGHRR
jgi:anti-sigma regulatory factor (Ser/Thr protein kinase)